MTKKQLMTFMVIFVLIAYVVFCFYSPEHVEGIAKGFVAIMGGFNLFM
jgi:hypothetical protein